jgi:ABC-2 type transport system permease protein
MLVAIIAFIGFIMLMTFLWPFETMHPVARYISRGIPFTYAMDGIRRLNLLGAGLNDVWQDLTILAGSIFVLAAAATIILRREIK